MSITVSEALHAFLQSKKTPANADLIERWHIGMETQVNVAAGDGEPVAGKRSTYSNGIDTWHSIRAPKDANSEPSWKDYKLGFSIGKHAEGIGCTGWDWEARVSRWVAFDYDSLMGHAKGVGLTNEELARVKEAAMQLPYVQVRKSTGSVGLHLYVYFDAAGIPCENHTVHAALARCVLGMMSSECNFDFASQIDCCGGVMWITCQCGHKIVGERKIKRTKAGDRDYNYYRCSKYASKGHPRIRLTEADLDKQVLALFANLRIEDEEVRDWVLRVLRARTREEQDYTSDQRTEFHRQLTVIQNQTDQLLNLRLSEEIDADTFAAKSTELRDRAARIKLQAEVLDRGHDETADIAIKVFELSQSLMDKWLTADYAAKRRILEIVCLNWRLDDVTLIPTMRKPFDILAEGLISQQSRGDWI